MYIPQSNRKIFLIHSKKYNMQERKEYEGVKFVGNSNQSQSFVGKRVKKDPTRLMYPRVILQQKFAKHALQFPSGYKTMIVLIYNCNRGCLDIFRDNKIKGGNKLIALFISNQAHI